MNERVAAALDMHPTTERAVFGYTGALAFSVYAAITAAGGQLGVGVVLALLAAVSASLGRYYHTAEAV